MGFGCVNVPGALPHKQNTLTGLPGQVVGFSADGSAVPVQGWSNSDLLINSRWDRKENIINQKGQEEYTSNFAGAYCIDRWRIVNSKLTILADGGIRYEHLGSTGALSQLFETDLEGQEVTLSILSSSGLLHVTGIFPARAASNVSSSQPITIDGVPFVIYFWTLANSDGAKARHELDISTTDSTPVVLRAAKLELGPTQTLAHQDEDGNWVLNDPPPDKALELVKCQRYQIALNGFIRIRASRVYAGNILFFIPLPTSMRLLPTLVDSSSILEIRDFTTDAVQQGFTLSTVAAWGHDVGVLIQASKANHGITDAYLVASTQTTPNALLDANL